MKLIEMINGLHYQHVQGNLNLEITGIAYHSKEVKSNYLFVAISGYYTDGHAEHVLNEAIENGASLIVVEKDVKFHHNITVIRVKNTRDALALLSANFYKHPTKTLNTIGITGTNGKTSITHILQSIFEAAYKKVGTIGTLGTSIDNRMIPNENTTPESLKLQHFLSKMKEFNMDYSIMEVSSHALALKRVSYMTFSTGIYTNLSPDHLELHKSMDEYFQTKAKLFDMTERFNIINIDDSYGQKLVQQIKKSRAKTFTYGIHENANFHASNMDYSMEKTTFTVHTPFESARITIHLPGDIYVSNSLAAIAAAYSNGIDIDTIQVGLEQVNQIAGRMETVYQHGDFKVIVDFAHSEDALQKTISTLKSFVKGRIILVFGVYADLSEKGREKRYGMGRVAAEYADLSIVTLDNPKYHDVETMIMETTDTMERNKGNYIAIQDREHAIQYAIEKAEKKDWILLAGKGHETTQIIKDKEFYFSEKEIVEKAMKNKRFN